MRKLLLITVLLFALFAAVNATGTQAVDIFNSIVSTLTAFITLAIKFFKFLWGLAKAIA